jgi:hypothetical protein
MARGTQGPKGGAKRQHGGAGASSLARIYEGPELLDKLLQKAGASVDVRGLIERFREAIAQDKVPPEVIPGLFPQEPRFSGPDDAMRFYANLFGVWDLLTAGVPEEEILRGPVEVEEEEAEEEEPEEQGLNGTEVQLPPRGSVQGNQVPVEIVDATWQLLGEMQPRERTRHQDRYANTQSELAEWARTVEGLEAPGQELLEYLCFELAQMFDNAFGDRFAGVRLRELEGANADEADALQPYAADYVAETLEEAEDEEDEAVTADEIALLDRYARRAIVAMTRATKA